MADFKFFKGEEDEFSRMLRLHFPDGAPEGLDEDFPGLPEALPLPLSEAPAVYLRLERNRDTISDDEWNSIIQRERSQLIELMWRQGIVTHTIISQDNNGLTLRTEVRNDLGF